jgi:hypothetical protein
MCVFESGRERQILRLVEAQESVLIKGSKWMVYRMILRDSGIAPERARSPADAARVGRAP